VSQDSIISKKKCTAGEKKKENRRKGGLTCCLVVVNPKKGEEFFMEPWTKEGGVRAPTRKIGKKGGEAANISRLGREFRRNLPNGIAKKRGKEKERKERTCSTGHLVAGSFIGAQRKGSRGEKKFVGKGGIGGE